MGPAIDFPIKKIPVYSSFRNHTSPAVIPNSPASTALRRPPEREPRDGEVCRRRGPGKAPSAVPLAASSRALLPSSSQACPAVLRSAAVLLAAPRRCGLLPRIQRGWRGEPAPYAVSGVLYRVRRRRAAIQRQRSGDGGDLERRRRAATVRTRRPPLAPRRRLPR